MLSFFRSAAPARFDAAQISADAARGAALLIDVREPAEVQATGLAKGAINLPLGMLATSQDARLAQARAAGVPVYLYCAAGARSGRGADVLRQAGFVQVENLGGLKEWQAAGGAMVR